MLMIGNRVTDNKTPLKKIEINQVVALIRNPNNELAKHTKALRHLMLINKDAYQRSKRMLKYIVPSVFNPPFRKLDNFAYSQHLILDLDKVSMADLDPVKLKNQLKQDPRVQVIFISPSQDGLKIIFELDQRISDTSQYSIFYKHFAHKFASAYNLLQVVDMQTNDATRACFLCHDPDIYYNPQAEKLKISDYVDFDNIQLTTQQTKQITKEIKSQTIVKKKPSIDRDTFIEIKKKLDPSYVPRQPRERKITVPQELAAIEQKIRDYLESELPQVSLEAVKDINYGKQFLFKYDLHYAEFNIFFGKKGITVVKTTKKINNPQFQEVMYNLINQILFGNATLQENT